jgi:hypothetical protein
MSLMLRTLRASWLPSTVRTATKVTTRKDLPWSTLLFDYMPTNAHIEFTHRDGKWDEGIILGQISAMLISDT